MNLRFYTHFKSRHPKLIGRFLCFGSDVVMTIFIQFVNSRCKNQMTYAAVGVAGETWCQCQNVGDIVFSRLYPPNSVLMIKS